MASPEELLGLINGLTGAIRDQDHASREVTGTTQQQISDHSHAINELSASVRSRGDQQSQAALRLPLLTLPEFTGGELLIDCFCEQLSQHSLQKLVPGIHCSPDGSQVELIHAFSIKLLPDIGKYLTTREQPFTDLLAAVECARQHESMMLSAPTKLPHTDVLYSAPPTAPPRPTLKTDAHTQQDLTYNLSNSPNMSLFWSQAHRPTYGQLALCKSLSFGKMAV
eukprot:gene12539-biopygen9999